MSGFHVTLGDAGIMAYHLQVFMAEDGLQGEEITSGAQIIDGEGMAQAMGMDVRHTGALGESAQHPADRHAGHLPTVSIDEKIIIRLMIIP